MIFSLNHIFFIYKTQSYLKIKFNITPINNLLINNSQFKNVRNIKNLGYIHTHIYIYIDTHTRE